MKIGVFDSGIGGITVLTELRRRFPGVRFVYLGDTANVPYGTRSPQQIRLLAAAAVARLRDEKLDLLVIACNTASSLAMDEIKASIGSDVPVLGVVEAGVRATLEAMGEAMAGSGQAQERRALVLATKATVGSRIYSTLLRKALGESARIDEQPCPLLVPMIEEGWLDHPVLHQTVGEYVREHLRAGTPSVALLACTHYPWIEPAFARALPGWKIINSASAVADLVQARLASQLGGIQPDGGTPAPIQWAFTDPNAVPPRFAFALEEER